MARYTLNQNGRDILTSWLFETDGYLDAAVNTLGVSARNALLATPGLDITAWIRSNTRGAFTDAQNWDECAMVWWIRKNDGVNITPQTRPPESAAWVAKLQAWDASIVAAFGRVSQQSRDGNSVTLTAEDGSTKNMPAGQQLLQQRNVFSAVISVLS